ncbi:MAG: hypothetical protein CMA02_02425 [Euryarchaeota archaeon]|nr:hypothetical protein [Euryarchaeota archaeon]|tara:strand:+ start:668 stop:2785 length:2118 start_codon:yes stop_codon:yes gene_type:complete
MGLHRGFTSAVGIFIIMMISMASISTVNAEELPDANLIMSAEVNEGVAWIGISCENPNQDCLEINITIVWPNGSVEEISSTETQEILANITAGSIAIYGSSGAPSAQSYGRFLLQGGWRIDTILPNFNGHEISDHPEHSGSQDVLDALEWREGISKNPSEYNSNTGTLSGSDTDVIHIAGSEGNILQFHSINSRYPLTWDILDTSGQAPNLIETLNVSDMPAVGLATITGMALIEIPSNEGVYLKLHSNDGQDENPYSFIFDIWSDLDETNEMQMPEIAIVGTIGPMDNEGDFYDLRVGPGSPVEIDIEVSDWIELRYIENGEMIELEQTSGIVRIENIGEMNTTLRIHIRSENVVRYDISYIIDAESDGETLGDAPDNITEINSDQLYSPYPMVSDNGPHWWWDGYLGHSEDIDYWTFEVTDLNGSIVHLIPATDSDDCCIMEIIDAGIFEVEKEGLGHETLQLENGTHYIRISNDPNRTSSIIPAQYSFRLEFQEIDEPIYIDRSGEFTTFYIVVGLVLLSPLLPIAYWQWKDRDIIRVERHERLRLARLRERLSGIGLDSQADEDIDAALSSLGDTEWDALIQEWGKPDVRHSTEDLELAAWRLEIDSPTLLIGIRPKVDWEHAGIRLSATMGERISIEGVHPSHLHFEDEIVLDKLKSQNLHFIRVQHAHSSSKLDVVVTGTVQGVPMAAMPSKALNHSEE